jgi:hypothetical protein
VLPELAHHMGLVPLFWLALLGQRRGVEWWWLALAFAVSWVADTVVHYYGHPWAVSAVYPVTQAAIVGAVFLTPWHTRLFVGALMLCGVLAVTLEGTTKPSLILHTVAWLSIVAIVSPLPIGRLRLALLTSFGIALVAWVLFTLWTTWLSWSLYQGVRAVGIGLFCWASLRPQPMLRVVA